MDEETVLSRFDHLVETGLVLYDPQQKIIELEDGGLKFKFILTPALSKKPAMPDAKAETSKEKTSNQPSPKSDIDTRGFEIGNIGPHHFLAANKFCFARPHLMLLTFDVRAKQYEPLYETDLTAAWTALTAIERDYVLFFNCGKDGGCSRLRKHMQLMPMPKGIFASFLDEDGPEPDVPFQWFYRSFPEGEDVTAGHVIETYNELLEQATEVGKGKAEHAELLPSGAACPHNMILTKRWMIVFPRRKNSWPGASAVGMLGYIAVKSQDDIDAWAKGGIKNTVREFGVSRKE
ncbi:hypothetical protein ACMFMG_011358 [Clarireedia jacksonii]